MGEEISNTGILGVKLPSCAILAVESRVCDHTAFVLSNRYNKMFQLHQSIFLGFTGDCEVFDKVKISLRAKFPLEVPNDRSFEEVALLVEENVNLLDGDRDGKNIEDSVHFLLLGMDSETGPWMYKIAKGENSRVYVAKKEKGMVVMAGNPYQYEPMETYLRDNNFHEQMTAKEAVENAFKAIRYVTQYRWFSGGEIKVLVVSEGVNTIYKWRQNNPTLCTDEYIQLPKMSFHVDRAPHYGVVNFDE